ncbi:MAG: alpha/beta hydrolase [Proteobacteria bacterium]|nr:alpha/beta hydrolase [Pseudomonadota bacterium]
MKKIAAYAGMILLVAYSIIMGAIYFKQDSMIYFPEKEILQTPQSINLYYREVNFQTKDNINISGWYIPANPEKGIILFCHGNAGNVSHVIERIRIFHEMNFSALFFDYRGYGKSTGKPSEEGTYLDAEAAWDYLIQCGNSPEKIIVYGQSLGGAIATEVAIRKKPVALIIESSFTSMPDLGSKLYPWLPVKLLAKYQYSTLTKISIINFPKLIIHSPDDEIVPFKHGRILYEKASQPKDFLEIRGGHNDGFLLSSTIYQDGLIKFFEKYKLIR